MHRTVVMTVLLSASLAFAGSVRVNVASAADTLDDALSMARNTSPECQRNLTKGLDQALDDLDDMRRPKPERLDRVRLALVGLSAMSPQARCPPQLTSLIERATSFLLAAQNELQQRSRGGTERYPDPYQQQPPGPDQRYDPRYQPPPPPNDPRYDPRYQPPPPPVDPRYQQPPPPPPVPVRDCGVPNDPGCSVTRGGGWAMDAETYNGFMASLRATTNELIRSDMVRDVMRGQWLTAAQLGPVLDLFNNELTRLDVAKICLPRTVNPSAALVHSTRFKNSLNAKDYTGQVSKQKVP